MDLNPTDKEEYMNEEIPKAPKSKDGEEMDLEDLNLPLIVATCERQELQSILEHQVQLLKQAPHKSH
jgi:hypothetical protein